jgi:hypothetical protein
MSDKNPILNSTNTSLEVTNLFAASSGISREALSGLPLGTQQDSPIAPLGVKVVIVGNDSSSSGSTGFQIPIYNEIDFTYDSYFNIQTIVYKFNTTTVATLTYTYATTPSSSGASPSKIVQS